MTISKPVAREVNRKPNKDEGDPEDQRTEGSVRSDAGYYYSLPPTRRNPIVSMIKTGRCAASLLVLALLSGCNGDSPTDPQVNPSSVTVNLRDVILAGVSVVATATATMPNGQTQAVTTGWRSDAPTVATITDNGNLNPLANGEATITVSLQGVQGSKRIRVAPNYDGRWQGMQVMTACAATGIFLGICEEDGGFVGLQFPISLTARHPNDLTVSGEASIEELPFPTFTTQIESDGRIRFTSTAIVDFITAETSWNINSSEIGRATGTIRERYTAPGVGAGDVVFESNLVGFMKGAADRPSPGSTKRLRIQRFRR